MVSQIDEKNPWIHENTVNQGIKYTAAATPAPTRAAGPVAVSNADVLNAPPARLKLIPATLY